MIRVAIFGGSFDPVHLAHLVLAEYAREARSLDKVVFVPAARAPHKPQGPLAPGKDRLEMLRLAVEHNPHFEVSAMELERDGLSYTLMTVRETARSLGSECEMHLIVGSDSLHDLPNWWHADELVREARVLCLERPGFPLGCMDELKACFGAQAVAAIREGIVEAPLLQISSSDIRRRIAQGRSIRYLVPDPVCKYIAARGLYRHG